MRTRVITQANTAIARRNEPFDSRREYVAVLHEFSLHNAQALRNSGKDNVARTQPNNL